MRQIGVMIGAAADVDYLKKFNEALELGITSCQINIWDQELHGDDHVNRIKEAMKNAEFSVSGIWGGYSGPREWNFKYGPSTIGLVPAGYRAQRVEDLLRASETAYKLGVQNVITHVGFMPENPNDPDYVGTVAALRFICKKLKERGQNFLFETGQETPVVLLRTIEDIGTGNVGVNLDTGNLILYGKANPVDALDVIGKYVMDTHFKDGFYPTDGMFLGKECRAGEGKADFPAVVRGLEAIGYTGPFTIEREISGEKQIQDIIAARDIILGA
jgi:sugar phosphate isomerase/epimerase